MPMSLSSHVWKKTFNDFLQFQKTKLHFFFNRIAQTFVSVYILTALNKTRTHVHALILNSGHTHMIVQIL